MSAPAAYTGVRRRARRRAAARITRRSRRTGRVATATARPCTSAIQNAREWTRFCADVLRRPELATDDAIRDEPAARRSIARRSHAAIAAVARGAHRPPSSSRASTPRSIALRAHELDGGLRRASATRRARPLARHRLARRVRSARSCRRCSIDGGEPAHGRGAGARRSTPTRFFGNSASTRDAIAAWRAEGTI